EGVGAVAGGFTSSSSNTVFLESATGIAEGARTGLANIVTGALFLVAMFFTPLYEVVPVEAAAPALIVVGALMMSQIVQIDFSRFAVALPAFLTIVTMPFTYSIANGIGVGFIAWVVLAAATGKARSVHPLLWVVAAAFLVFFGIGPISDALALVRVRARRRRPRPGRSASGRSPRPQQLRPATRPPRRPRACGRRGHLR